MTVEELIAELQKYPPQAVVYYNCLCSAVEVGWVTPGKKADLDVPVDDDNPVIGG